MADDKLRKRKTAEDMAKEQKEISISEFFEKNKHLLGFDNPTKALLICTKEACDNSLTYDMPIIIKEDGRTKIVKIGELVDRAISENHNKTEILRDSKLEKTKVEGFSALSFDSSGKLRFRKISAVFRHKVNSDIFRVRLESGRYVDLTAFHSVFTLKEGKIVSVPTSEIIKGTHLVVPKSVFGEGCLREINLIDELLELDENETTRINIYGVSKIFTDSIINKLKSILPKNKRYRIQDFKRFSYLPMNLLRKLNVDLNLLADSKIGTSLCRYKIPAIIKTDNNFAELMGLYVSEGSTLKNMYRVCFSFGSHEMDMAVYTADLFEKVFGFRPNIGKAHKTAINVKANCYILGFVLKKIFVVGDRAKTKKIPQLIFDLPAIFRQSFLMGYLAGDGYPSNDLFKMMRDGLFLDCLNKEKITLATSSHELFVGLQYLLSSLGISYSCGVTAATNRTINDIATRFSESYNIYIYSKRNKSQINKLPIKDVISHLHDAKIKYALRENKQTAIFTETIMGLSSKQAMLHEGVLDFIKSDLGLLKVVSVTKITYDKEWVYDVSVPECENFVAGVGAILCHNSLDACEDAGILPDIIVKIKQMKDESFRITIQDNGPGIIKEQIAKIFGKLLYGSKFHKLRQNRGQQGIGISASVLYSQLTTGNPTRVWSKTEKDKKMHYYELFINTAKNEPEIVKDELIEPIFEHGVRIEMDVKGRYRKWVDDYLRQTSIANPFAKISYTAPDGTKTTFPRSVNDLPKSAKEMKPHPYGVEFGILQRMLQSTASRTLAAFLSNEFSSIGSRSAKEICKTARLDMNSKPQSLDRDQIEKLLNAMQKIKIQRPPTDCLSPIGQAELEKSLKKEFPGAEFVAVRTREPDVYHGFPFMIEVAVVYGGDIKNETGELIRFANRVPLLYQAGACATSEAVKETDWKRYGLQQQSNSLPTGPMIIVVHMCSIWVPFVSESKEAIAPYPDIVKEMKLALQDIGRELSRFLSGKRRAGEAKRRVLLFERYSSEVAEALAILTGKNKKELEKNLKSYIGDRVKINEEGEIEGIEGAKDIEPKEDRPKKEKQATLKAKKSDDNEE